VRGSDRVLPGYGRSRSVVPRGMQSGVRQFLQAGHAPTGMRSGSGRTVDYADTDEVAAPAQAELLVSERPA